MMGNPDSTSDSMILQGRATPVEVSPVRTGKRTHSRASNFNWISAPRSGGEYEYGKPDGTWPDSGGLIRISFALAEFARNRRQ